MAGAISLSKITLDHGSHGDRSNGLCRRMIELECEVTR